MRSQGPIHESLQHSGVQHQIGLRVRVALPAQLVDRIVKGQPLRDARRQLAFFFQLFVDLKILPGRRIVLSGSDAVLGQIGQRQLQDLRGEVVARLWNHCPHRFLRRFPQNARGFPIFVAVDLPALRIAAGQRDASQLQSASIGHGDVPVDTRPEIRDARPRLRPDPSAWAALSPATTFRPSPTQNPVAAFDSPTFLPDPLAQFIQRFHSRQIDAQLRAVPASARWRCASLKPGITKCPPRSMT